MVFGSCRAVSNLEQAPRFEWPACPIAVGQLVLRKPMLSPTSPPKLPKRLLLKSEKCLFVAKMNCCFRVYFAVEDLWANAMNDGLQSHPT
jgi:hypothetical protein